VAEDDVAGAWLVVAATDDDETNALVCRWATDRGTLSVNASRVSAGTARIPAVTRRAGLVVGVASESGADPRRVRAVRNEIDHVLTGGRVDLRHRRAADRSGTVTLVGGGPGAEDLMTVRGRVALAEADVVVADRLGPTSLLRELAEVVEVIDVGKAPGNHSVPQEEINRIIVEQAQRGRRVVRLKGGDPFLFGRGGEEVAACRAHGIPVEVVPGVSSALAAPASAGIPVTHRGTASAVHVAHGHGTLSGAAVACVVEGSATLVILMGVATLPQHVAQLVAAGASGDVPVAVVERASTPGQRVTRATLATVVAECESVGVQAPAVVVVGATASAGLLGAVGVGAT
jgi:uroporphyrin-III C-methyltransferase/precorrin-2 dehydrogenase/sirohydrochlorin ferrochelatase